MKQKDIVQQIREKALSDMPDVFSRIPLESAEIGIRTNTPNIGPLRWRTLASALIAIVFVAISGIVLLSQDNQTVYALETDAETIGYQILSGAMFLQNEEPFEVEPLSVTLIDQSTSLFEENIGLFSEAFAVLEGLIGAKSALTFQLRESDDPAFAQSLEISVTTLDEETITYQIYLHQFLKKRIAALEGEIRFQEETYTFRYLRLTGSQRSRLTIANGLDMLIVTQRMVQDGQSDFRYQWMQSGSAYRTVDLKLTKEDGALVAEFYTTANQKNVSIQLRRTLIEGVPTLHAQYRFGNGVEFETGDIDVIAQYDQVAERIVYQMNGLIRRGNQDIPVQADQTRPGKGNAMPHHGPR
jgi:hypothetical protein